MSIKKRQFGHHAKDNGDEWWFYLCNDTNDEFGDPYVIIETEFDGDRSERRFGLAEYLGSGERGRGRLVKLIASLVEHETDAT